ncbi:MAG TPA: hypothetical protein PK598_13155, partial [Thermoanaerobaculia bacterium]|nr:hypothetical protein [Thermoanaerobaculia bacterium]
MSARLIALAVLVAGAPLRAQGTAPEPLTLPAAVRRAAEVSPLPSAARSRGAAAGGSAHQAGRVPNPAAEVRV